MSPDTAAAILNVDLYADGDAIRAAFKMRSRMWHPDRFASGTERERAEAAIEFIRVTTAFEVLLSEPGQSDEDVETPRPTATNVAPQRGTSDGTTPRSSLREYLGFGASTTGFREYLGFGSPRR
jgi:DnaJ-class molecular chaperone